MNLTLPLVVVLMVSIRRLWGLCGKSSCKLCRQERKAGILLLSIGKFSPPLAGRDLEASWGHLPRPSVSPLLHLCSQSCSCSRLGVEGERCWRSRTQPQGLLCWPGCHRLGVRSVDSVKVVLWWRLQMWIHCEFLTKINLKGIKPAILHSYHPTLFMIPCRSLKP